MSRTFLVLLLLAATPAAQSSLLLRTVLSGGTLRWFRVHVPPGYVHGTPTPLVLGFHGGGGNATGFATDSGMCATADAHGFLAVFPEGTPGSGIPFFLETWNAGNCCGSATANGVDDVQFTRDVLAAVAAEWSVDQSRIFATGLSNGGMLAYRLGVELSDRIAAIAPVAAALGVTTPPNRPIPVMAFHGALDTNVPWQGGVGTGVSGVSYASQHDSLAPFVGLNQVAVPTAPTRIEGQALLFQSPPPPTGAPMAYWWLLDQGHSWPGRPSQVIPGEPFNTDIDPNEEMWAFFAAHPRTNASTSLGGGCSSATTTLTTALPVLGQPMVVTVQSAHAWSPGALVVGPLSAAPVTLTPGCTTWIAPATSDTLQSFQTGPFGGVQATVAVPMEPWLHGLSVGLQAVVWTSSAPDLGNTVRLDLAF